MPMQTTVRKDKIVIHILLSLDFQFLHTDVQQNKYCSVVEKLKEFFSWIIVLKTTLKAQADQCHVGQDCHP